MLGKTCVRFADVFDAEDEHASDNMRETCRCSKG